MLGNFKGERWANDALLVIGSQCESLGRLSFLPKAAEDLYAVMTDPEIGGWVPALPNDSLLLDPTCTAAHEAIGAAYQRASDDEATLLLAFLGHGEHAGRDFVLLPYNARLPPMAHTTLHLVQLIKDLHGVYSGIDGLVVLLDACYAGVAASGTAARWVSKLTGTLRIEVLTAVADRTAADGCFSRTLVDVLNTGIDDPTVGGTLRCEDIRPILMQHCKAQLPQLPTYNAEAGLLLTDLVTDIGAAVSFSFGREARPAARSSHSRASASASAASVALSPPKSKPCWSRRK